MKQTLKKNPSRSFFGIGLSSILIIFVLLCLMVFAMLSLVSAGADWRLENRLISRTSAYYEACAGADSLLEEMDRQLEQLYLEDPDSYGDRALSYLETLAGETADQGDVLSFSFVKTIDEGKYLSVTVSVPRSPAPGGTYYQIQSWSTGSSQAWEPDEHLNVLE